MKRPYKRRSTNEAAEIEAKLREASASKRNETRRGPISPGRYLSIHQGKMDGLYKEGVVTDDDLQFVYDEDLVAALWGKIYFGGKIVLSVRKYFELQMNGNKQQMVTRRYSYQCHFDGKAKSEIFRYDNYHEEDLHEGHTHPHHVHRFDRSGKERKDSPNDMEHAPFLDDVIREAHNESIKYAASHEKFIAAKPKRKK